MGRGVETNIKVDVDLILLERDLVESRFPPDDGVFRSRVSTKIYLYRLKRFIFQIFLM